MATIHDLSEKQQPPTKLSTFVGIAKLLEADDEWRWRLVGVRSRV